MYRRELLMSIAGLSSASVLFKRGQTKSEPYRPLGRISIDGAKEAVLNADGTIAFVATTDGFAVVDIGDPRNPTVVTQRHDLLAERERGPLPQIYDVKVEDDLLVVAGPANFMRGDVLQGVLLFDVSDPSKPNQLAFHETDHPIHNCFIRDGYVYLAATDGNANPFVILNARDGSLSEVGRWSLPGYDTTWRDVDPFLRTIHDMWVQDGRAYLAHWDAGVWIVDVRDPTSPSHITHFGGLPLERLTGLSRSPEYTELPGNVHYVMVNDDASLLALNREAWDATPTNDSQGGPGVVELWNIENITKPTLLSTIRPPATADSSVSGTWTTPHNLDIAGDRLYTSWYEGGVKIHDISQPAQPKELAWWRQPSQTSFWTTKVANEFFVASSFRSETGDSQWLYTFPDRAGTQRNQQRVTSRSQALGDGDQANGSAASRLSAPTESRSNVPETQPITQSDGQPGFGFIPTAIGILTAWKYRFWSNDSSE